MTSTFCIIRSTLKLSLTLSFSRLLNMLTMFIGTMMISRLGHLVLASSALITLIQTITLVLGVAFLYAVGIQISRAVGKKKYRAVGAILHQGLILATALSVIVICILSSTGRILTLAHQPEAVVSINVDFFKFYLFSVPATFWMLAYQQFLLAVGRQYLVIMLSFFSTILTIFFSFIFIFGHFSMPKLGVEGLGVAYLIQSWLILISYLLICHCGKLFTSYKLSYFKMRRNIRLLKGLIALGWPICLQTGNDLLSFSIITLMVGWLGVNALSAQQIVTQYFMLLVVPIFAIAQASSILVGRAYGAGSRVDAARYGNIALIIGLCFGIFVILAFVFFSGELIHLYLGNASYLTPGLFSLTKLILILTGFRLFFDIITQLRTGSLRGLLDSRYPMLVGVITTWLIGVPLSYILGFCFSLGLVGITIGGLVMLVLSAYFVYFRWKNQTLRLLN